MSRARRIVGLTAAVVALMLATACGVPPSDGARPVQSDIAGLLERDNGSPDATAIEDVRTPVVWVREDRLVPSVRFVPAGLPQEQLDAALAALLAGPKPEEQERGLATLLPPDLRIDAVVEGRRAVVDLGITTAPEAGRLPLAVGQVALTALGVPEVRSVTFLVDGDPTSVDLPGGGTARVVRLSDYADVVRPPA